MALIVMTLLSALTTISALVDGQTQLVSVNREGQGSGNNLSSDQAISADGRFVAFASGATDLVKSTDINGVLLDVFRHDRETGETTLVSVSSAGESGNERSFEPVISADGRFVAFLSSASDLLDPNSSTPDTNGTNLDVYVRDLDTNVTTLVSVNGLGTGSGNGGCSNPVISANGRFVAFVSSSGDLVINDGGFPQDVFVRDLDAKKTTRVSVNSETQGGNSDSFNPVISADGLVVAFTGNASNLVAGVIDNDGKSSVFVREWKSGVTALVSVNTAGTGNGSSVNPAISADGRFVAFRSDATDLVAGATDANNTEDVFVREWKTGLTTLVSATANSAGMASGNRTSGSGVEIGIAKSVISADGRFVAFVSLATDLVADKSDTNDALDVFVRDRDTGVTTLVSENSAGQGSGNNQSDNPVISREGRFVAFRSLASDLVTNDTVAPQQMSSYAIGKNKRRSWSASTAQACPSSITPLSIQ